MIAGLKNNLNINVCRSPKAAVYSEHVYKQRVFVLSVVAVSRQVCILKHQKKAKKAKDPVLTQDNLHIGCLINTCLEGKL